MNKYNNKNEGKNQENGISIFIHNFFKNLYFDKLKHIKLVNTNINWVYNPSILTCCIIEPRIIDTLPGILHNIANIYGNKGVGLTIYHGNNNIEYIKTITESWKNVIYKNLNIDNLERNNYSYLLTQKGFYKNFTSSHVLIFQSDSYIFRKIPDYYFQFDYIGAPWVIPKGNGCGNGGTSLRNVATMIRICGINGSDQHEDLFFSKTNIKVCTNHENHKAFSTEGIFHPNPVCCHQPYYSMNDIKKTNDYFKFLEKIK